METKCIRVKLKEGSLDDVRNWFQTLNNRANEVLESLENEGVIVESVFLEQIGGESYLIYYMKAESFEKSRNVSKNSTLAIDQYHKECKTKYLKEKKVLELLMDFSRFKDHS